jgi:Cys-rich protein (TIGR01571 family)
MVGRYSASVALLCFLAAWTSKATPLRQQIIVHKAHHHGRSFVREAAPDEEDSSNDNKEGHDMESYIVRQTVPSRPMSRTKIDHKHASKAKPTSLHLRKRQPVDSKRAAEIRELEQKLAANREEQAMLKEKVSTFSDQELSDREIESMAEQVAKENESPKLGKMLGQMWKHMRKFKVPKFLRHAKEEQQDLRDEESALLEELQSARSGEEPASLDTQLPWLHSPRLTHGQTWNFWEMNGKQQKQFGLGSLVYFFGGMTAACLYYLIRQHYPGVFRARQNRGVKRDGRNFTVSILGCLGDPRMCLVGCCCPCVQWADTMERHRKFTFFRGFLLFFILTVLYGYTCGVAPILVLIMGVYYRQKLREFYNLESGTATSVASDCLAWFFCQPCAIIQEAREGN